MPRGVLHRGVVQPNVGDVEAGEHAAGRGFPGDAEHDGLAAESLFPFGGPGAIFDQVLDAQAFATSPDAGGRIEGECFFGGLSVSALFPFTAGDDRSLVVADLHLFELPRHALALAMARLVFEEEHMILGGEDADTTTVVRVIVLAVNREHRNGGSHRVGWQKRPEVQHGAERDVPQIGRCAVIADHAVREHGERMGIVPAKHTHSLHAKTASAVRVIDKHEFATVGVRFFQSRELSGLGTEDFVGGECGGYEHANSHAQRHEPAAQWSGGVLEYRRNHFDRRMGTAE